MINEREQSVKHLASLYTVIIGVALSSSVYHLIDPEKPVTAIPAPSLMLFVAFILLIFPFYHGAMRHLDNTYLARNSEDVRDYALLLDFLLLFLHGLIFVVISMLFKQPEEFLIFVIVILGIDVLWGFLAHLAFSTERENKPEMSWVKTNAAAAVLLLVFILLEKNNLKWLNSDRTAYCAIILGAMFFRTAVDYGKNWNFYFPAHGHGKARRNRR